MASRKPAAKPAKRKPSTKAAAAAAKPASRRKAANNNPQKHPDKDWKPDWLKAFARHGLVSMACEEVGISRQTAYKYRQRDEDFALAWHDVEEKTTDIMEREAYRRGVIGVERPVFQGGVEVGRIREHSDTLLIFMLKARKPDVYRENVKVEHGGRVRHTHDVDLKRLTDADLDTLEQIAAKLDIE